MISGSDGDVVIAAVHCSVNIDVNCNAGRGCGRAATQP